MKKKFLFVADWPDTMENVTSLQALLDKNYSKDYEWKVWSCKRKDNNNKFYRWISYFKGALYIINNRKKYHAIFIWQQMVGFILFEMMSIFKIKIPNIVFYTFVYHTTNFFKYVKKHLVKNALKHSIGLVWPSSEMTEQVKADFKAYEHKNHTIINPNMDILDSGLQIEKELDDPYFRNGVYTAGKSARDFNVVIKAFRNTDIPVTIVCPDDYPIMETETTPNIRILRFSKVSSEQYYALARQAFCVVNSVDNDKSTYGLLLIMFAMDNKIPIISTDSQGVKDYLINNVNGVLFKLGHADEIRRAYERLKNDDEFRNKIIQNAKETAKKMSPGYFIENILGIVEAAQQKLQEYSDDLS